MVDTLSATKTFTINLIPIDRTSKQFFTKFDMFLNDLESLKIIGVTLRVIKMAFTLLKSCYFHGKAKSK